MSTLESYSLVGEERPIPVCHVLFVPQWDLFVNSATFHRGSGGDERQYEFSIAYTEQGVPQFGPQTVTVRRRFLLPDIFEGGGRRFNLADGNIFVVAVARNGALSVSQVPHVQRTWHPAEILAAVKKALPNDARVQALSFNGS